MTLSVTQTLQSLMLGWSMNDELVTMWMEAIMAFSNEISLN
jgi:hypothetical protein